MLNKIDQLCQKGFDVPINLERQNTLLTGKKDEILRLNQKFKLNLLIVYPNLTCSTKEIYKKNKKIIEYIKSIKGCYFSRITGSGSACIGIFSNMKNAIYARKLIKLKYPNYWCVVSKTM